MKNLVQVFKSKYKVKKEQMPNNKQEKDGTQEQEAAKLTLELNTLFVVIPLLQPYNNDINLVRIEGVQIEAIQNVLNADNEFILNNEFYIQSKEYLQRILNNDGVIELNQEFNSKSKIIQKLAYSLQGKEYWEEKYL